MITGYYFSSTVAVLLFSWIGMAGLSMVFFAFLKKWFPKLPTGIALTCLLLPDPLQRHWVRKNLFLANSSRLFPVGAFGTLPADVSRLLRLRSDIPAHGSVPIPKGT